MPTSTFFSLLAALLMGSFALGAALLQKPPAEERAQRIKLFLLGIGLLLLLAHFSLEPAWSKGLIQSWWAALHLLSPFILGGLSWLFRRIYAAAFHASGKPLKLPEQSMQAMPWLLVIILALLALFFVQPFSLLAALLPGALMMMYLWHATPNREMNLVVIACLFLVLLGLVRSGILEPMLAALPEWIGLLLRPVLFFQSGVLSLFVAYLAYQGVESLTSPGRSASSDELTLHRYIGFFHLGLAVVLVVEMAVTIFWASVWDLTDDSLSGIWMVITASLSAMAAGGFLVERYRGHLRLMGLVFLLAVPFLNLANFSLGIRYPYLLATAQRAQTIENAVERYEDRNGSYPASLAELAPRDLIWVPRQLILRGEDWCYQGGSDYYRLGAYWRMKFSSMLGIEEYAKAGSPPDEGWVCLENLVQMKVKYDPPMFLNGGQ
jgi:hypothetical protein